MRGSGVMAVKLLPRPSRRRPGTVKWSPTPTASREAIHGDTVRSQAFCNVCSARAAGGLIGFKARSVGIGPCSCRAFLLMVGCHSTAGPARSRLWLRWNDKPTREAPSALRPASTSVFAYLKSD